MVGKERQLGCGEVEGSNVGTRREAFLAEMEVVAVSRRWWKLKEA